MVCTGITSNNEPQFISTTVVSDFPVKREVCQGNNKFPLASSSSVSHLHHCHIPRTEVPQRKGMNRVPDKNAGSRSNTRSSREQCAPCIAKIPYLIPLKPGFLNKRYIYAAFIEQFTKKRRKKSYACVHPYSASTHNAVDSMGVLCVGFDK